MLEPQYAASVGMNPTLMLLLDRRRVTEQSVGPITYNLVALDHADMPVNNTATRLAHCQSSHCIIAEHP